MGQKLHVAEFGNDFWDLTPKPQVAKENSREVKCLAYFTEHRALGGHRTAERPSLLRLILRFVCRPCFVRLSSADGHGCFCHSAEHRWPCLHLRGPGAGIRPSRTPRRRASRWGSGTTRLLFP